MAAAILAAAYLIGSIPFSFLVARAFGVEDVRQVGSGNVGATNVLRSAGVLAGVLALLLDVAKGAAATLLARRLAPDEPWVVAVAALVAMLGHTFPVWLRFRGGKGVATGLGVFLPLAPAAALGALFLFLLIAAASRFASLGSVLAAIALPLLAWALGSAAPVVAAASAACALVVFAHRENLRRLREGTERRLGSPPSGTA
jgi:glycerol-3-phosphate acyltransferase PlsY